MDSETNTKGIEIKDDGNDCKRICCVECGRWVRRDIERIRHAGYCESKAQPTPLPAPAAAGREVGELCGIAVLDHVVVAEAGFVSLAARGWC
jgi:hypothetical protein